MAGCDLVGSGSETVGDGGHLQPPSCHCGPLERAPEGGQALFGVPIFLCRLFSGKLSLLFIEIHCVKILRFVSRWTEKRVFCGKTFDYGVPIPRVWWLFRLAIVFLRAWVRVGFASGVVPSECGTALTLGV